MVMEVLYDRVAGLDVGKASVTVCVRTPGARRGRHSETRTFKTTSGSLRVMRDWLVEAGVTIAAIESTSTYWKPPFYCLEEVMEIWLLNAAHMKAVPGRKTDVRDAEWIAQLLEHGLLTPSFVPPPPVRQSADADPVSGPAAWRPNQGDGPVGADAGGRVDQALDRGVVAEHGARPERCWPR